MTERTGTPRARITSFVDEYDRRGGHVSPDPSGYRYPVAAGPPGPRRPNEGD